MRDFCFFEEIFHFWFKTQPINTITSPSRSQDGELVRNLLVYLDNWKRWSELPIGSSSFQDVLANQLFYLLTLFYVYSGVLSLPVMRLVCLAEPSFRTCRLLLRIQSKISYHGSGCWSGPHSEDCSFRSSRIIEDGVGLMVERFDGLMGLVWRLKDLTVAKTRVGCRITGWGGTTISAIPMPCWGHFLEVISKGFRVSWLVTNLVISH